MVFLTKKKARRLVKVSVGVRVFRSVRTQRVNCWNKNKRQSNKRKTVTWHSWNHRVITKIFGGSLVCCVWECIHLPPKKITASGIHLFSCDSSLLHFWIIHYYTLFWYSLSLARSLKTQHKNHTFVDWNFRFLFWCFSWPTPTTPPLLVIFNVSLYSALFVYLLGLPFNITTILILY